MKEMKMRISVFLALAALAACDKPAVEPAPAKEIMVRSESQKQLFELNDLNRAIALKRAIRDFGPNPGHEGRLRRPL
jgi:hypothetical protein